jgi:choice-of-anchor B domain-containing protein
MSHRPAFCLFRLKQLPLLTSLLFSAAALSHAEHDRARFVAPTGKDAGRCDSPVRACQSISYAVQQASKGDRVLVAEGQYKVQNADDLFYLTSKLVPVLGGYNKFDHFLDQAPGINSTILTGVPDAYIGQLQLQGFVVVNDGFSQRFADSAALEQTQQQLQQSQGPTPCVDGKAGIYPCKNIDLVSHVALADISLKPGAANDIWGHTDLNTGTEYAIIGLNNGTAVFSLADPAAPKEVGAIAGSRTSWRDIKVLQYYDDSLARWRAYAYVSSEGSDNIQILDLNQLPGSVRLVAADKAVTSAHNVYISHVDYTTNTALDGLEPTLHIVGQKTVGGAFTTYGLKNPEALTPYYLHSNGVRSDYTHDAASMVVDDNRAQQGCQRNSCTVLMDFNEQSVRLWDITTLTGAGALADLTYPNASYVHSGWWSEDKRFVFIHDELDERDFGLNTTVRVMNVDNLKQPVIVKEWTGPTGAIDHNGYTRGNRYYISNYQRGTTILDITNPANPVEAGFFDSFPSSDSAAFNGVWGTYPYLPSGLVISADINSGLFVLRDQTKQSTAGQVSFATPASNLKAGETAVLKVRRPSGSGAVSVGWETLNGFGIGQNTQLGKGRLNWVADDFADKEIRIAGNTQWAAHASYFVRLFDPQNGLTLGSPSYHQVTIGSAGAQLGAAGFQLSTVTLEENGGPVSVKIGRFAGSSGALTVSYQLKDDSAKTGSDIQQSSGTLSWADGDTADKTVTLTPIDDSLLESEEQLTLQLSGTVVTERASLLIKIRDNEQNRKPEVQVGFPAEVNAGAQVSLKAQATDPDGDTLTYSWTQVSGDTVSLSNASTDSASFIAPNRDADLQFSVSVMDSRGLGTSVTFGIKVKGTVTTTTPVNNGSSGGSGGVVGFTLLGLLLLRRRP